MIKKLSFKFFICLFLLVTLFSVASSCFAIEQDYIQIASLSDYGLSFEDFEIKAKEYCEENEYDFTVYNDLILCYYFNGSIMCEFYDFDDIDVIDNILLSKSDLLYCYAYDASEINLKRFSKIQVRYTVSSQSYSTILSSTTNTRLFSWSLDYSFQLIDIVNVPVYYKSSSVSKTLIFEGKSNTIDTSFNYVFEGISKDDVRLCINDLNSDLNFYASFNDSYQYDVGDILDYDNNMSISKVHSDEKGLYYVLSPKEYINYYICNSNNEVLKIGTIDELVKGYFLYGYETGDYINFIFLKDGVRYWDDNLNFYYSNDNNNYINYNSVMTHYSYIEKNKVLSSETLYAKVVDNNDNILSTTKCTYYNDLYEVKFDYVSSYFEYRAAASFGKPVLGKAGVAKFSNFYLIGYNSDGSVIDFSNYYIKWHISSNANILGIKHNDDVLINRSGVINGTSSGNISYSLEFHFDESSYKPFNINFDVYDSNNNLVYSEVVNTDSIIKNQIDFDSDKVNNDKFEIESNPNYTGGSSNNLNNFGNIQDWTVDDYTSLMSTDNFVWEFFKAILGNLPWWIEVPLTILIFGVVIITIIRFARGA